MSTWNNYTLARTLNEAMGALRSSLGPARPIAGGTDSLLEMQQGHCGCVDTLVDVSQIPELNCLEIRADQLFIGAGVSVRRVSEAALVRDHALAVAEACALIGGPQVRNTATLGGNVAHALPAADGMIALAALDAQVEIASEDGLRRASMLSLFAGPGKTTLVIDREILVGFYLPLRAARTASAFARVMRPQGVALPVINLAIWMARENDCIADVRIAAGPTGPTPRRATAVEDCLRGARYQSASLVCAEDTWRETVHFRTSAHRASAEYRQHLSSALFEQVIAAAWLRTYDGDADAAPSAGWED